MSHFQPSVKGETSLLCLAFPIACQNVKGLTLDYAGFALQRTRLSQILATRPPQLCSLNIFFVQKLENDICVPCEDDRDWLHVSEVDCTTGNICGNYPSLFMWSFINLIKSSMWLIQSFCRGPRVQWDEYTFPVKKAAKSTVPHKATIQLFALSDLFSKAPL